MLRYVAAAKGGMTTKAESPATLPLIQTKTMIAVTSTGETFKSILCIRAARKPLFSATPVPMTATSTTPRGA